MRNTSERYGLVARVFHWVVAVLIILMWSLGIWMSGLPKEFPDRLYFYGLHKSTGIVVLTLAALRLLWRLNNPRVLPVSDLLPMQILLAEGAHMMLYFLMFMLPITGWAMSSAAGYPVSVYGLFELPMIVGKDPDLAKFYNMLHGYLAYFLAAVVALHVIAALWHHFVRKDNVLRRMLLG